MSIAEIIDGKKFMWDEGNYATESEAKGKMAKYEKDGLSGLEKLYTELGEHSKVRMARDQLSQVEREREEMRNVAKQSETSG